MPAGIATLVYKDSAGTNRNFLTFSTTGDLTGSFTAMTALQDGAGALISPATSGKQDTGNTSLAALAATAAAISTAALASHLVVKSAPGAVCGVDVAATADDGWLMLLNAAAAPADGAVTPVKAWQIPAGTSARFDFARPIACGTGIVLVFSSTGPFVKTAIASAFLSGDFL